MVRSQNFPWSSISGNTFLVKKSIGDPTTVLHIPSEKSFKFKLKGCEDAKVALMQSPADHSSTAYYFEIGAQINSITRLFRLENDTWQDVVSEYTPFILDCKYFTEFWITFDLNGTVSLDKGPDISTSILTYDDPKPLPVHAVTFSGDEFDIEPAEFEFLRNSGADPHTAISYLSIPG